MNRKMELTRMMLHSLMSGMTIDEKLVFLTDVFCLTEDMRDELPESDATLGETPNNKTTNVPYPIRPNTLNESIEQIASHGDYAGASE